MRDTEKIKVLNETIKVLQKQLQESEEICEELNDFYINAPCGFHSLDKDGIYVRINDTELRMLGYSRDDVIGKKKLSDILAPDSLKIFQDDFPKFKEKGYTKNIEYEMVRKDGTIMPILLNATAIKDEKGNYIRSRATIIDITEHKKMDKELRKKMEELEVFNKVCVDRELRMVELKKKIAELEKKSGDKSTTD